MNEDLDTDVILALACEDGLLEKVNYKTWYSLTFEEQMSLCVSLLEDNTEKEYKQFYPIEECINGTDEEALWDFLQEEPKLTFWKRIKNIFRRGK